MNCPICKKADVEESHFISGPTRCRLFFISEYPSDYCCTGCGEMKMSRGQISGHLRDVDLEMHFAERNMRDSAGLNPRRGAVTSWQKPFN